MWFARALKFEKSQSKPQALQSGLALGWGVTGGGPGRALSLLGRESSRPQILPGVLFRVANQTCAQVWWVFLFSKTEI